MKPIFNWQIGFVELITAIFIGAKLNNSIHWSWWWVLAPMWIVWAGRIMWFLASGLIDYGKQAAEIRKDVLKEEHDKQTGEIKGHQPVFILSDEIQ